MSFSPRLRERQQGVPQAEPKSGRGNRNRNVLSSTRPDDLARSRTDRKISRSHGVTEMPEDEVGGSFPLSSVTPRLREEPGGR